MASRVKEDEKNERIIRGLLKLTPNRRCINCNSLGPQYVCTNFSTFVCTTCSGIHREFTHRVKSVSMAKFTSQEVTALQGGGNERAKEIFFKEWDAHRNSFPDNSNIDRLRDFIKHVYVDKRYTGEKRFEKPPTGRMGDESYENRRTDMYQGGSRSPPYEDTYERRYNDRPSPGGRSDDSNSRYDDRSPGFDRENKHSTDYGRSPSRPEVVNDWRRDDRFGNTRRPERSSSNGDIKSEGRSPDYQKDSNVLSPVVRPVRDILGENVIPLRIDPPKSNGGQVVDSSAHVLRTTSSSSMGSNSGNPVEPKKESLGSLIDFDADPEPPVTASVPQAQQTTLNQTIFQPISSTSDSNWASFDMATETKVPQVPSNVDNLDSMLAQLSVPAAVPGQSSGPSSSFSAPTAAPVGNRPFLSSIQSNTEPFAPSFGGAPSSQQWKPSPTISQAPLSVPPGQLPQAILKPTQEAPPGLVVQPSSVEVKPSGRKELPEDIFAAMHPSFSAPVQGWQTVPPTGMGFMMQYNTTLQPNLQQSSKSTNPFDFTSQSPSVSVPTFPSTGSLQGALPNMPPSTSLGTHSPAWMTRQSTSYTSSVPPQAPSFPSGMPSQPPSFASAMPTQPPPFASAMPTQPPPFASTMPSQPLPFASTMPTQPPHFASATHPGAFMGQQLPNHMLPSRHQGVGGFGNEGAAFGSRNQNQLMAGGYSAATTPNAFPSVGGNPFG